MGRGRRPLRVTGAAAAAARGVLSVGLSQLASLPCTLGPGSLHRVIAACQKTFLDAGAVAVGPSPKVGKSYATPAKAQAR